MKQYITLTFVATLLVASCSTKKESEQEKTYVGEVEVLSDQLNTIIPSGARPELIADGFDWSEGPLWLSEQKLLIWSDVPINRIYQWDGDSVSVYLEPSGYTGQTPRGGEMGSNGLLLDAQGHLVLCQHGDRRIARMDASLSTPTASFTTLADNFDSMKFNSPNDAAFGPNGNLYFTDPPYGLEQQAADSLKETEYQGVYRISPEGEVFLMTRNLSRPNGIAFSRDYSKCYVSNSDPERAVWLVYDVDQDGNLTNESVFFDATSMVEENNGLPDGMKVNKKGFLFATGPGGVFVFTPQGEHLGTIKSGAPISNCALNEDESVLFMTSDAMILKIDLVK
ncbi:MAG: SMP-30/gluconolactonase/LRE family protein [Cyclobacteriaceae bacterium]